MSNYEKLNELNNKKHDFYIEKWTPAHNLVCQNRNKLFLMWDQQRGLEKEILEIKKNKDSRMNIFWKKKHKNPEHEIKTLEQRISDLKIKIEDNIEKSKPYIISYLKINDEYNLICKEYFSLIALINKQ